MKKFKAYFIIAFMLGLALQLFPIVPVLAAGEAASAPASGKGETFEALPAAAVPSSAITPVPDGNVPAPSPGTSVENRPIYGQEHVIQGVSSEDDMYFNVNKGRQIAAGSYIELTYSHSPTLLPSKSTFTVMLDGIPLGSVFLDAGNRDNAKWRLDISAQPLKEGFHKLSLVTHMEVSSNLCDDQESAANWMRISKQSYIHLLTNKSYTAADFAYFPSPFLEEGSVKPLNATIVLPDRPSTAEVGAAVSISQGLASLVPANRLNFDIVHESELTDDLKKGRSLIWLGSGSSWSSSGNELETIVLKEHPAASGSNYIALTASPWNPEMTQLFVNGSDAVLKNAARILTEKNLTDQLLGNFVTIPDRLTASETRSSAADEIGSQKRVTFAAMGYDNLVVESLLVGTARISYPIPSNWQVKDGISLKLQFRHSKTLNFAQSVVSLKVNGVPLTSEHLNEETSDNGMLQVTIPAELFDSTHEIDLDVTFQFNSSTGKEAACSGVNSQVGNWALIDKSSYLSFSYQANQISDLKNLPTPLIDQNRWNSASIVIPDQMSSRELSVLATAMGFLGRNLHSDTGLDVVSASAAEPAKLLHDRNVIYVGTCGSMPSFIKDNSDNPVTCRSGHAVVNSSTVTILPSLLNRIAWMELTKSPFNKEKSQFIIAATSPDMLSAVQDVFSDPAKATSIQGRLSVIDEMRQIHTFQSPDTNAPVKTTAQRITEAIQINNLTVRNRLLLITAILIGIAVIGGGLWVIRKRK